MRVGHRLFPYPVLNNDKFYTSYRPEIEFGLKFDLTEEGALIQEGGEIVFKNLRYILTDKTLLSLVEKGSVEGQFIVQGFRYYKSFRIGTEPYDLHIPVNHLSGRIFASCLLCAVEPISPFKSEGFHEDYDGYSFSLDRGNIVAADDGILFDVLLAVNGEGAEDNPSVECPALRVEIMSERTTEMLRCKSEYAGKAILRNPKDISWLPAFLGGPSSEPIWVATEYEIEAFKLKIPKDESDFETNLYNAITLYEHFKALPNNIIFNERFWCWVNFKLGYEVAQKYAPIEVGADTVKNHWLFTDEWHRGPLLGPLSRLFFCVHYTVDETSEDPYELTRFVIENQDRINSLWNREFSASESITRGALRGEKRVFEEFPHMKEKAERFEQIALQVSFCGSVSSVLCFSEDEYEEFVYKKYKEMVESNLDKI